MIRSNYLVHWTGKDINLDYTILTDEDNNKYVNRLKSIMETGIWLNEISQEVYGGHPTITDENSGSCQEYRVAASCFTEIRLSKAFDHAREYGLLGVAVDRSFVLHRYGAPVWYVRGNEHERIAATHLNLRHYIHTKTKRGNDRDIAIQNINYLGVFLKPMSKEDRDDFTYLEENEWRIVFREELLENNLIHKLPDSSRCKYCIHLEKNDVKLIVVPNDKVRGLIVCDKWLKDILGRNIPILTIEDCKNM